MNVKLIAVAIAALGLTACGPDIKPGSGAEPSAPTASSEPAAPAATPATEEEKKLVRAETTAVPSAQEDQKAVGTAPATEVNTEAPAPATEAKPDEAAKAD